MPPIETYLKIEKNFSNAFTEESFKEKLSKEAFKKFLIGKKQITVDRHGYLFKEGCFPTGVYFINEGTLKLYKKCNNEKEHILRICKEKDLLGYRSLLCNEPFGASAQAISPLKATFLPSEVFNDLLMNDSALSYVMLQKIAYELGQSSNTAAYLAQKTVRERFAEVLLLLEEKLGVDILGFINITLTRKEMADLIGTATENVIKLFTEFKADNLVELTGRTVKIINHERLRSLARVMM